MTFIIEIMASNYQSDTVISIAHHTCRTLDTQTSADVIIGLEKNQLKPLPEQTGADTYSARTLY